MIHYLVKAAGKNANLLMNIGPQPDGCLPEVAVQRLKEVGEWMKVYGETIYGLKICVEEKTKKKTKPDTNYPYRTGSGVAITGSSRRYGLRDRVTTCWAIVGFR